MNECNRRFITRDWAKPVYGGIPNAPDSSTMTLCVQLLILHRYMLIFLAPTQVWYCQRPWPAMGEPPLPIAVYRRKEQVFNSASSIKYSVFVQAENSWITTEVALLPVPE